ncbi:MAG: hypothetical protein ABEJ06_04685 [Haloarculaceae archaeon]
MVAETLRRAAVSVGVALLVAFVLGAVLAPPDPVTQLYVVGATLVPLSLLVYLLRYRGGYARLRQLP